MLIVVIGVSLLTTYIIITTAVQYIILFAYAESSVQLHGSVQKSQILYDNFDSGGIYTLADGQTSPNGKWQNIFNGGGLSGVQNDGTGTGNNVFFMYPSISRSSSDTNANLVISTQKFSNFEESIDINTVKQLRQNSPPNTWEVGWIFFRYVDAFHYYWFTVKPNGIELGKKDCDTCTDPVQGQQCLASDTNPTLNIGSWSNWKVNIVGNHIIITVNGNKVVDFVDQTMSPKLSSGSIGMYNEDASVRFDNVYVTPHH
jgi:hypothetical protein